MSNYRYIQKTLFLKIDTDTGGPIVARDGMLAGNSADKINEISISSINKFLKSDNQNNAVFLSINYLKHCIKFYFFQ